MARHAVAGFRFLILMAAVCGFVSVATAADPSKPENGAAAPSAAKEPAAADRIAALIKQLGDKDYFARQKAQEELAKLGFEAFDALNAATTSDDLEIASRAKYLLRLMRVEWTAESDPPEVKKYLRDYELEEQRSREARMHALAGLPNGQGIPALCRLVRFEKSLYLSKMAAVALLGGQVAADPPNAATIETVRKALAGCTRPGALWLLTWTRLGAEPELLTTEWTKLIDAEQKQLRLNPNGVRMRTNVSGLIRSQVMAETSPEIIAGLTRFQVSRFKKLGKIDEAMKAIRRLVEIEPGNPESLAELLEWLCEQKAWKAVDDLAARFAPQFGIEPGLLYMLAKAYADQGRKEASEQAAARALALNPGKEQKQLMYHLMAAQQLRQQGLFPWARREFEHVITQSGDPENDELRVMTSAVFAEMLHDQSQDLDAAEALKKIVSDIDSKRITTAELGDRKPSEIKSRMHYFFACHWEAKGDMAKQREELDKAVKAEPSDVDVLIACYRLPDQPPGHHAEMLELVKKAAEATRQEIAEDPDNPSPYNQFAWLIGNTEGDFDEALRFSQKSLELKPDEGGFFDTMARVYYAKGDLENAVKQQTKAAEFEPHSGLIKRQLEFFRKKLEEKKKS